MEGFWLFYHWQVTTALQHVQPGVRQPGTEGFAVLEGDNAVQTPPDEEGIGVNGPHLTHQLCISTRTLDQVGHQAAALPLPLKLWSPTHVLPLSAKPVGLRRGNQAQAA